MKNNLTTKPLPGLIRSIAVPASVGFFFNTMYNVVDTYYAGLISTQALAALSISFPVFFVLIAMGTGISTGATALIANSLGAGKEKEASHYAMQAISFSIIMGLILTLVGIFSAPFLFRLLGASGEYLAIAAAYIDIILLATVFFALTFVFNSILNSQGDTRTFRNFLIIGFFLNLLFNPALMYGWGPLPALGLPGIAWATFLIQLIGVVYMSGKAAKSGLICSDCWPRLMPESRYYLEISRQGFPASLNMMTVALGVFIITYFIAPFGQAAVAAYGIATRLDQMALLPTIGLNIAALALIGQNNGARRFDRVRECYRLNVKYGFLVAVVGMSLVLLLPELLMNLFTPDPEVVRIGGHYLVISALMYPAYMLLYISVSALQGLKKPMYAVWIGIYRQIALPALLFPLLAGYMGWGLLGIWWGIFMINWSAAFITVVYVAYRFRRLPDNRGLEAAEAG